MYYLAISFCIQDSIVVLSLKNNEVIYSFYKSGQTRSENRNSFIERVLCALVARYQTRMYAI